MEQRQLKILMQKLPFKVIRNFRLQLLQKKKYKNRGRHYKNLK